MEELQSYVVKGVDTGKGENWRIEGQLHLGGREEEDRYLLKQNNIIP